MVLATFNEALATALFKMAVTKEDIDQMKKDYDMLSSDQQKQARSDCEKFCNKFMEKEGGDKLTYGYGYCCEVFGHCGGMSGWIIALIIFIILGVCASGAAAFWFFYWNRKHGGQEEKVEGGKEDTESTSTEGPKSVIEIPVGTY